MEKVWLKSYPEGVAAEIDPASVTTLVALQDQATLRFAARPAFTSLGHTITYADLDRASAAFAAWLQSDSGLQRGDRVALMLPNILQYPIALFGCLRAGMVVVNVNPLYTPRELTHQLKDSGARALVALENFCDTVEASLAGTAIDQVIVTSMGDALPWPRSKLVNFVVRYVKKLVPKYRLPAARQWGNTVGRGDPKTFRPVDVKPGDLAFLQYTGGTTGVAKGAMLSHGNVSANLAQMYAWSESLLTEDHEIVITALPLYHVFALVVNCLAMLRVGGLNVLIANPRDMAGMVKEIGRYRFTCITGVNTLFNALLHDPEFRKLDFSGLKSSLGGGMAIQKAVAEQWYELTGCKILQGYGLTEASPVVSGNPVDMPEVFDGTIGLPYPSTDISIRDEQGLELGFNEPGELWVRGPQVMQGYWGREAATREVITDDGYLKTGDIATIDERGYLRIVDRKKDMVIVSGFNVFPNEIEDVVVSLNGVLEAACIGVPDERTGEAVKLFVVPKPGVTLTEDVVRAHCRANLTAYKVPRHIEFRDDLPKTNVGKILRRALRDE